MYLKAVKPSIKVIGVEAVRPIPCSARRATCCSPSLAHMLSIRAARWLLHVACTLLILSSCRLDFDRRQLVDVTATLPLWEVDLSGVM